jgi:hypothetical protein
VRAAAGAAVQTGAAMATATRQTVILRSPARGVPLRDSRCRGRGRGWASFGSATGGKESPHPELAGRMSTTGPCSRVGRGPDPGENRCRMRFGLLDAEGQITTMWAREREQGRGGEVEGVGRRCCGGSLRGGGPGGGTRARMWRLGDGGRRRGRDEASGRIYPVVIGVCSILVL